MQLTISVSPKSTVGSGFNTGLIIGKSTVISKTDRVKTYNDVSSMLADGFATTDPEYKAALLYFAVNPRPNKVVIGRWDGTGTETALQAVTACRNANSDWYACTICGAAKADIIAVAAYIEASTPKSVLFYTTADADVKAGTAGNVTLALKGANYKRTIGQYSTTADAVASIMGYAMGANTGTANSAYTLAYKKEPGVTVEALTATELSSIKGANCNTYINRGSTYDVFEQGIVADGTSFDEIIGLDILADDIQKAVMDVLTQYPKVPQTEEGMGLLYNAINSPCLNARTVGFLAPGVWNGPNVLNLRTGDTLSQGYTIQSESIASQSVSDRQNRIAPPIYVAVKLAGAVEHVVITVNVDR